MKPWLAIVLLATSGLAAAGDWKAQTTKDAKTGRTSHEAFVTSPSGDKFTLSLRGDGSVWGHVQLAPGSQFADEPLTVRVDNHKPAEFSEEFEKLSKKMGNPIDAWDWTPGTIGFRMWYGYVDEGCGMVKQIFQGKKIVVTYEPKGGRSRDLIFDLAGNQKAISDAVGFDVARCP